MAFGYDPLEERVLAFTAAWCGVAVEKIDLFSRLVEDLGLTNESAARFFDAFAHEFEVNLDALRGERWKRHFVPQGLAAIPALIRVYILLALFLTAGILGGLLEWIWLWLLVFVAIWMFGTTAWPLPLLRPEAIPITVQDLVDAAAAGRWVKPLHP